MVDPTEGALLVRHVTKHFGTAIANEDVSLSVLPGTVHGLLGENGAGKSTLVSIINGLVAPDSGEISFGDDLIASPTEPVGSPLIATVHQQLALVPVMSGIENIALALGTHPSDSLRALAADVQAKAGTDVDLSVPLGRLELPVRQRIEVIKALCRQPRLLILDEPTTFLPPSDTAPFLRLIRQLADSGMSVLFITHRLEEVGLVADQVTVLRHGRVVGSHNERPLPSADVLAREIVGESIPIPVRSEAQIGDVVLRVQGLTLREAGQTVVDDVSMEVRHGEILGVAGVDGNGQLELLELIAGLRRPTQGSIELCGQSISNVSFGKRAKLGLQLVSGDRTRDGIVPTFTIEEHFEYMLGREMPSDLPDVLREFDVRPPRPRAIADELSGGNQQKMIMARALQRETQVLMVSYPTQGLDVMAAAQLQQFLLTFAQNGTAIVLLSSSLDELLLLCDSVVVMNGGSIVGRQDSSAFDRDEIATWYTTRASEPESGRSH